MNRKLNKYYRAIGRELPCTGKRKKQILADIQQSVELYYRDHPDADFAQIESHFGSASQIVSAYVEEMDAKELIAGLRTRKTVLKVLVAVGVTVVAIWLMVALLAFVDALITNRGYFVITSSWSGGRL